MKKTMLPFALLTICLISCGENPGGNTNSDTDVLQSDTVLVPNDSTGHHQDHNHDGHSHEGHNH